MIPFRRFQVNSSLRPRLCQRTLPLVAWWEKSGIVKSKPSLWDSVSWTSAQRFTDSFTFVSSHFDCVCACVCVVVYFPVFKQQCCKYRHVVNESEVNNVSTTLSLLCHVCVALLCKAAVCVCVCVSQQHTLCTEVICCVTLEHDAFMCNHY